MKLEWIEQEVPTGMKTKQVYAVVFNKNGKILLKKNIKNGKSYYGLAGGKPEPFDKDRNDTLRREYIEEVDTVLDDKIVYMGYQLVDEENDKPPYAQIRMVSLIKEIREKTPDPDNGQISERELVSPEIAIKLLNWGEIGEKIIHKAVQIATNEFGIDFDNTDDIIENV